MSSVAANREIYHLLKEQRAGTVPNPERRRESSDTVRVVDWDSTRPITTSFSPPSSGSWGRCTTPAGRSGGICKRIAAGVHRTQGHPPASWSLPSPATCATTATLCRSFFWSNALTILSNGSQSRIGSVTAGWEHFAEWKRINDEGEQGIVSLETMIRGTCDKDKLLDLVENFTVFEEKGGGLAKKIAKNHQYLGVNNAIHALLAIHNNQGKLGVFWHTQGSGKERFHGVLCPESSAQAAGQLDLCHCHRPAGSGRADLQEFCQSWAR